MSNAPTSNPGGSESEPRKIFDPSYSRDEIQSGLKADDESASISARKHDLDAVERGLKAQEEANRAAGGRWPDKTDAELGDMAEKKKNAINSLERHIGPNIPTQRDRELLQSLDRQLRDIEEELRQRSKP